MVAKAKAKARLIPSPIQSDIKYAWTCAILRVYYRIQQYNKERCLHLVTTIDTLLPGNFHHSNYLHSKGIIPRLHLLILDIDKVAYSLLQPLFNGSYCMFLDSVYFIVHSLYTLHKHKSSLWLQMHHSHHLNWISQCRSTLTTMHPYKSYTL